ncbi:MFS family permease [Sphingobium wenxiniae]|uniref:Sugar phosphate permease n=1 Tax=Sphingobium wenxiniae (strain DSM 21828 / CGMCC 1.7748 / JZ-1) TaxID=595605 RepID=A0A562K1Q7_SPHWJ|nr:MULTISPECIES: MFS transporter [Sphingobium]MBB6193759.1 MFS family permease [Sphingobium wenxiniae]TWH89360.1 sugar phosphate permease [Sphingobium wenxiniae]WRD75360.1 MFS transporter [Sphingobium baderi]
MNLRKATENHDGISAARQRYIVGILLLMYVFAYMDRTILSLMVDPIKHSLRISDIQFSLVHGVAFGLFYALLGLPMGWIVDRFSKRWVLFWGIFSWSAATVSCGLARSFPALVLSRFGVGAGEATLVPVAYTTIARALPKHRTAMGIAIFSMGSVTGAALAIGIGGYLIAWLTRIGGVSLPLVGHLEPWQGVFLVVGAPGILVALLAFTLPDAPRDQSHRSAVASEAFLPFVIKNRAYLFFSVGGLSLTTVIANGMNAWMPALLMRRYGLPVSEVGLVMSIVILNGIFGFAASGYLADRLFKAGHKDGHLLPVLICTPFIILLSIVGFYFSTDVRLTLICAALLLPLLSIGNAIAAHVQLSTPPALRGRLAALTVAAQHFTGLTLGPLLVAAVTDHVFRNPIDVGRSMAVVATGVGLLSGVFYLAARKYARAAIQRMERDEIGHGS